MRSSRLSAGPSTAAPSQTRRSFVLWSWKSFVVLALAATQLVSFYLLVDLTGRQERQIIDANEAWVRCPPEKGGESGAVQGHSPAADYALSVVQTDYKQAAGQAGEAAVHACVPQQISAGQCSTENRGVSRPQELNRETCAFDLHASDVVFGVWHSLATEGRLQPLLDTWGAEANVVLLASTLGARDSKLFKPGVPGSKPHLLDTGILEDDYFSTLGKAFVGLRLMFEAYPTKKWFVVLGDDNYVLMDNYINVLSAFDPDKQWALSRMVFREKFGCKVAGGASVITSRAMTQELLPHLEPWYQGILKRSGGDVHNAPEADKYHDIAFQRLVEAQGHTWVHLDELPHEPPGYYFDPHFARPKGAAIPARSALFHYVPGRYMYYLHFVSSQACTCALTPAERTAALSQVAVGVYSPRRRLSKLDSKRIAATWGQAIEKYVLLKTSGVDCSGIKGDVDRIQELVKAFPNAEWFLLLPVEHYVVPANLAVRIRKLQEQSPEQGGRGVMISGPGGRVRQESEGAAVAGNFLEFEEGALLMGRNLAEMILSLAEGISGGVFPTFRRPGDREIFAWARTINRSTVLEDSGFLRRFSGFGEPREVGLHVGCPAVFPMTPDLADLKPEFTMSEADAVLPVTKFLLDASPEKTCSVMRQS